MRRCLDLVLLCAALLTAGCGAPDAPPSSEAPAPVEAAPPPPAPAPPTPPPAPVSTADAPIHGVDVSHFSLAVDWTTVRDAGFAFAYVKATEGVDSPDPSFADHWRRLGELGMPRGAYHFYVTEDDPEEQARFFLDTIQLAPGDLRPAVDIELIGRGTSPGLADRLHRFLQLVEAEVGAKPLLYTSPTFWDAHLDDRFGEFPLWVAEYDVEAPRVPEGWTAWTLWQFEDSGSIPGIEKDGDRSRLQVGLSLDHLRIPPTAPPP